MALQLRTEREASTRGGGDGAPAFLQSGSMALPDWGAATADAPTEVGAWAATDATVWPNDAQASERGTDAFTATTQSWTRAVRLFARSVRAFNAATASRATGPDGGAATLQVSTSADVGCEAVPERHRRPATSPPGPEVARLTRRQREVAALIAQGYSDKQIAQELVLTPGTASNHVAHILRRLECRSRAEVA